MALTSVMKHAFGFLISNFSLSNTSWQQVRKQNKRKNNKKEKMTGIGGGGGNDAKLLAAYLEKINK
jgi:hypothetical protein